MEKKIAWKWPILVAVGYVALGAVLLVSHGAFDDEPGDVSRAWQIFYVVALVAMLVVLIVQSRGALEGPPPRREWTTARIVGLVNGAFGLVGSRHSS